ncbi:hypothetical protein MESS2_870019 [Mesorhizobium metallidurans STM 2683]|uniref:Tryptophan synthase beta chain-like PALP domain-containing protein n=1 Tax=Mesorhizobium metallidurans STM 2683 TaxID=1297569 RepID=M5FB69_9HYPH|nr:hypothetical protein MESS2_870019 [Mesorhizobium metallidurans STM 2683]
MGQGEGRPWLSRNASLAPDSGSSQTLSSSAYGTSFASLFQLNDHRRREYAGKIRTLPAHREDCNSGLAFGGNKLRKLEYIIPDAIASDTDTLVTVGDVQSNHTRIVAAAAKIGMKCLLVQESWVPHEDVVYDRVGNILLSRTLGAEVRLVDEGFDIGIRRSWEKALYEV